MTKAPDQELQELLYARLRADPTVTALVYSNPPDDVAFPYIRLGEGSRISDDEEHVNVALIDMQIHVFSREGGWAECRGIADAVKKSLHDYYPVMIQNALRVLRAPRIEYVSDPDGITVHAVVMVEAEIEESN